MITAEWIYWLAGAFFLATGVQIALDRSHAKRWTNCAFWSLLGLSFFYGSFVARLPLWPLGLSVIAMALIAGTGLTSPGKVDTTSEAEREASARARGDALFAPALTIPAVTVASLSASARSTSAASRCSRRAKRRSSASASPSSLRSQSA